MDTELVFTFRSSFSMCKINIRVKSFMVLMLMITQSLSCFLHSIRGFKEFLSYYKEVTVHIAHARRRRRRRRTDGTTGFCVLTTRHTVDDVMLPHEINRNNQNKHANAACVRVCVWGRLMNLHERKMLITLRSKCSFMHRSIPLYTVSKS